MNLRVVTMIRTARHALARPAGGRAPEQCHRRFLRGDVAAANTRWRMLLIVVTTLGCAALAAEDDVSATAPGSSALGSPHSSPGWPDGLVPSSAAVRSAPGSVDGVRAFTTEAVFDLISAELLLRRERYDEALEPYLFHAYRTRDPGVVALATRLAAALDRTEALGLAELWSEVAPGDLRAHAMAAQQHRRRGRMDQSLRYERAGLGAEPRRGEATGWLSPWLSALGAREDTEIRTALDRLGHWRLDAPDVPELARAMGLLLAQQGHTERALAVLAPYESLQPVGLAKLRVLLAAGEESAAEQWLEVSLNAGQKQLVSAAQAQLEKQWRLEFVSLLFQMGQWERARQQLQPLHRSLPNDEQVALAVAFVALKQGDGTTVMAVLKPLVRAGGVGNRLVHFYLGQAAEQLGLWREAQGYYGAIKEGQYAVSAAGRSAVITALQGDVDAARSQLAALRVEHPERARELFMLEQDALMRTGAPTEAFSLLTAALAQFPGNVELMYARALVREVLGDLSGVEEDLNIVLAADPGHSAALNTLGYMLADRTERLAEALSLIEAALVGRPDDPAVIDSMGWVQFRMGNTEAALVYLQRAFARLPDHEIAAHLGEVLWSVGRTREAVDVWQKALVAHPESQVLRRVLWRFTGDGAALRRTPPAAPTTATR